jgi:hypothetical protein
MLLNKLRKTFAVTLRVNHKIIDVLDTQNQSLILIFYASGLKTMTDKQHRIQAL